MGTVIVRIRKTPDEEELDGVRLDDMRPGSVREVSASVGSWLIAQRYAEPEMRTDVRTHEDDFLTGREQSRGNIRFGPRRRRSDWR